MPTKILSSAVIYSDAPQSHGPLIGLRTTWLPAAMCVPWLSARGSRTPWLHELWGGGHAGSGCLRSGGVCHGQGARLANNPYWSLRSELSTII